MKLLILGLMFLGLTAQAKIQTVSYKYEDFETARKAENNVIFKIVSHKLGFLTKTVKGVVKDYTAQAEPTEKGLKNAELSFKVEAMDTDEPSRNNKMHDESLDFKKSPVIKIKAALIPFGEASVPATIFIRGKEKNITLKTNAVKDSANIQVKGEAKMSFKELEIPDPGIAIASVEDGILVEFQIKGPQ